MFNSKLATFESKLEQIFAPLPNLPANIKELLINFLPYLCLGGGLLTLVTSGIGHFYTARLSILISSLSPIFIVLVVVNIIIAVLLILNFKPLKKRQLRGWRVLFLINTINIVVNIISLNIFDTIPNLLGYYFLFQLKSYYS